MMDRCYLSLNAQGGVDIEILDSSDLESAEDGAPSPLPVGAATMEPSSFTPRMDRGGSEDMELGNNSTRKKRRERPSKRPNVETSSQVARGDGHHLHAPINLDSGDDVLDQGFCVGDGWKDQFFRLYGRINFSILPLHRSRLGGATVSDEQLAHSAVVHDVHFLVRVQF